MDLEWQPWGMSALSGVLAGLVAGYMIAWRNWKRWWVDRDVERLYEILLGLSRFREVIAFCEAIPPTGQLVPLAESSFRVAENARVLHDNAYNDVKGRLDQFVKRRRALGNDVEKANGSVAKDAIRDEARQEVDFFINEIQGLINKKKSF